ncbi:MAG: glycoside hydrolase family 3 C-terminal domain-containing protein, partial [Dehalococcoidales bacterium]|nr:glycoside hydrolase family 3 C-terminal domain-containing protein [Dehalococcoidales bacterium]
MVKRIDELIGRMTLEEKVSLMSGIDFWHTASIERLGISSLKVTDGPHGARAVDEKNADVTLPATCFPTAVAMGATWNPDLIHRVGAALGEEARARGCAILLGPCVNIHRSPLGGRNFESFSEDPYLSSRMAVAWITGLQSQNVGASVKHFALNNQEFERMSMSSEADERTIREIYFPSFEKAVKQAGTWTVMCSYNRINGTRASENAWLLTDILKEEWGFEGPVISDWFAVHSTAPAIGSGLDLEMPGPPLHFGKKLVEAVKNGEVDEAKLDDSVRRILAVMQKAGGLEQPLAVSAASSDTPEHRQLAREAAGEAIVLLKNENNILPLNPDKVRSIAVIGPNAAVASIQGGGSSQVEPYYAVSPLEGLLSRCPDSIDIRYELGCPNNIKTLPLEAGRLVPQEGSAVHGLKGDYFNNNDLSGAPVMTRVDSSFNFQWFGVTSPLQDTPDNEFSIRWTGVFTASETGAYTFGLGTSGWARIYIAEELVCSTQEKQITGGVFQTPETTGECAMETGKSYPVKIEYCRNPRALALMRSVRIGCTPPLPADALQRAVDAAGRSDAAIVFAGLTHEYESEGYDRPTMDLPEAQV